MARQSKRQEGPAPLQRFRSQDLLTSVFPAVTGDKEEIIGDIPLPDHPRSNRRWRTVCSKPWTWTICSKCSDRIDRGEIELIARDTCEPLPSVTNSSTSNPYAFLDGGSCRNGARRGRHPQIADRGIRQRSRPPRPLGHRTGRTRCATPDSGCRRTPRFPPDEIPDSRSRTPPFQSLASRTSGLPDESLASRSPLPNSRWSPDPTGPPRNGSVPSVRRTPILSSSLLFQIPDALARHWDPLAARLAVIRGLIEICGPVRASDLAHRLAITVPRVEARPSKP